MKPTRATFFALNALTGLVCNAPVLADALDRAPQHAVYNLPDREPPALPRLDPWIAFEDDLLPADYGSAGAD